MGTSLVVQWLRLYIPNAGAPGMIPGQETRSHMLQLKIWLNKMLKKYLCINSVIRSTYLFTAGVAEVTKVVYAKYGLSETIHPEAYSEYIIKYLKVFSTYIEAGSVLGGARTKEVAKMGKRSPEILCYFHICLLRFNSYTVSRSHQPEFISSLLNLTPVLSSPYIHTYSKFPQAKQWPAYLALSTW